MKYWLNGNPIGSVLGETRFMFLRDQEYRLPKTAGATHLPNDDNVIAKPFADLWAPTETELEV